MPQPELYAGQTGRAVFVLDRQRAAPGFSRYKVHNTNHPRTTRHVVAPEGPAGRAMAEALFRSACPHAQFVRLTLLPD